MLKHLYRSLLVTGIILLLFSFFKSENTLDVHLYDTYYIADVNTLYRVLGAVLLFYWLAYILTTKLLHSYYLTWAHVMLTLALSIFIAAAPFWQNKSELYPGDDFIKAAKQRSRYFEIISMTVIVLAFGQLIYLVNLIAGIIKRLIKGR